MNAIQREFVEGYVEGTQEDIDDTSTGYYDEYTYEVDCTDEREQDRVFTVNYIDNIQLLLEENGVKYSLEEQKEMNSFCIEEMEKKYGYDNVYYDSSEQQLVPVNGRIETVHGQMAVVVYGKKDLELED